MPFNICSGSLSADDELFRFTTPWLLIKKTDFQRCDCCNKTTRRWKANCSLLLMPLSHHHDAFYRCFIANCSDFVMSGWHWSAPCVVPVFPFVSILFPRVKHLFLHLGPEIYHLLHALSFYPLLASLPSKTSRFGWVLWSLSSLFFYLLSFAANCVSLYNWACA